MPINIFGKEVGKLELFKWEYKLFKITKIKKDNYCRLCNKVIKSGCYCLGEDYCKICLECVNKVIDNFQQSLKEIKKITKPLKELLEKNKGEYIKNNLINSV